MVIPRRDCPFFSRLSVKVNWVIMSPPTQVAMDIVQDWDVGPNTLRSFWVALSGFFRFLRSCLGCVKDLKPDMLQVV